MTLPEAKRLKALENAKLKKLPGFKKVVGSAVKREAIAYLQAEHGLSEQRACLIVGADRKMIRYRSQRPPDTELRGRSTE